MYGKTRFGSFWAIPRESQTAGLESWRTWLVNAMIYFGVLVFPLSMLVTFPVFIREKLYALIAIDVGFYVFIVFRLVLKGRFHKDRRSVWLVLIYLMTISFHVALGPLYARPAWLIMAALTAAFLFGTRAAAAAVLLNMAILLTLYWAMGDRLGVWANVHSESLGVWIMYVVNISLITLACALPVGFLLQRLDISLKHERKGLEDLSAKAEKLQTAYSALQRETQERKEAEEALKASEEKFRNLVENVNEVIYSLDAKGVISYVNPAVTRILGYQESEIIGKAFTSFVWEQDLKRQRERFERLLDGPIGSDEYRIIDKKGQIRWVHSSTHPVFEDGIRTGLEGVLIDITDRKQAEEEKKKLESQLVHAQKMEAVGTLAGGIAHDFNNSLQGILGYSQMLLFDMAEDSLEADKLRHIEAAALRASELTKQLLTFSRRVGRKLRPVDLRQEVRQVEKLLRRTIPRMIDIELRLESDVHIINADAGQIEQVIMNLGINARDAMPDGGKLIIETEDVVLDEEYCKTHFGVAPGNYVMLSVTDNGTGMDRATLEHIFEPFFTTKDPGKGTGLGLAIVYGIVKDHGGYIECYSEPGEGTAFRIYFPVLAEDRLGPLEQQKNLEIGGGRETILLVDDDHFIRELGEEMLCRFGYRVFVASDGESALEIFREQQESISLVILDLIMPGMGGHKCLEEILRLDPAQKVIIASGYSVNGRTSGALKAGARGYIKKPYEIRPMLQMVRQVLDQA